MKGKKLFLIGSVVLVVMLVVSLMVGGSTAVAGEKVYRMKIQSAYPRGDLSMELLKERRT